MTKKNSSWYTEKGTATRPCSIPGMVALYRCGKFIAFVPESDAK